MNETIEDVFENLKNHPLPVLVADSKNRVIFKNITGSRCFSSMRSGVYIKGRYDSRSDSNLPESYLSSEAPVIVTLSLSEYDCCCLVVSRDIDGMCYRFYTLIPHILEFYSADADLAERLCECFSSCIEAQIKYLDACIAGNKDTLSSTVTGQLRGALKAMLLMQDKMRVRLGLATGLPAAREENDRSINVSADVQKLADNFNIEYGKEILRVGSLSCGLFCRVSRAAFGRVITYVSFLCVKYAKSAISIESFAMDNAAVIKFHSGTDMTLFLKYLEIEFSYIKTYAEKYGIEVTLDKAAGRGSEICVNLECVDYSNSSALRSSGLEIAPSRSAMSAAYYEAASLFMFFDGDITDE